MDDHDQQEPERVGEHMALAALDLLPGVEAARSSTLRGFHALAVDHARRRAGLAPLQLARTHDQHPVDGTEQAHVAPGVEIALDRRHRRKVLRQGAPLTARRGEIEDRVHHLAQIDRARSPAGFRPGQQRRDQRPLAISHVAWIAPRRAAMLRSSGISPAHPILQLFARTEALQPTDIAQLLLVQALRVFSDWGRSGQAAPSGSWSSFPWVARFSSRSTLGRRMMGSGGRGVPICFTALRAAACRSGTLNGIASPLVPMGTIRATPSGVSEVPSPSRCPHAAGSAPKRKSAPSRHMRCRITASLRATATRARAMPRRLAICIPQARRRDHFRLRTSSVWAAS